MAVFLSLSPSTSLNFSISIRTELGTDFKIPAAATLSWPHLFVKQTLEFLPTTVGNSTVSDLSLVIYRSSTVTVTVTTMYASLVPRPHPARISLPAYT